jgi:hypothetical protein
MRVDGIAERTNQTDLTFPDTDATSRLSNGSRRGSLGTPPEHSPSNHTQHWALVVVTYRGPQHQELCDQQIFYGCHGY